MLCGPRIGNVFMRGLHVIAWPVLASSCSSRLSSGAHAARVIDAVSVRAQSYEFITITSSGVRMLQSTARTVDREVRITALFAANSREPWCEGRRGGPAARTTVQSLDSRPFPCERCSPVPTGLSPTVRRRVRLSLTAFAACPDETE